MVEIYDEETLTEFELNRQRNIIKNYEFMKACGKYLIGIMKAGVNESQ